MADRAAENQSTASKALPKREDRLARISRHRTAEVRNRPATTSLRLLTVLNVLSRSDAERKSLPTSVAPR